MKRDFKRLRHRVDGADRFMLGHQVKKVRKREREIPAWTLDDGEVRRVVSTAFPGFKDTERSNAGRWVRAIHLYYRLRMPNSHVAQELGISVSAFKFMMWSLNRVQAGLTAKGKPRNKIGRGRPKKSNLTDPPMREAWRKENETGKA